MKKGKKLDSLVELMFYKLASGVQFNIMDLIYVSNSAKNVLLAGGSIREAEEAMLGAISVYRVN